MLKAAAAVFAERGFHRASIRDVAGAGGMSLAGLYYYFPSKADLLYHITARAFDVLHAKLDGAAPRSGSAEGMLRAFVENHLDFFLRHPDEMKVLVRDAEFLPEKFQAMVAERKRLYYARCHEILRGLDRARRSEDDLRTSTLALFGMLNWTYSWYRPDRDGDTKRLAARITELFLRGFLRGGECRCGVPERPRGLSCHDDEL